MARRRRQDPAWPPRTVSRAALLRSGSDEAFRRLVDDMVQFAGLLQKVREQLARELDVSPPQYKIVMLLSRADAPELTASQIARRLGVSLAMVVTEGAKLERKGLISRDRSPRDARSVILRLTPKGRRALVAIAPLMRTVNDALFAPLSREGMNALARTTRALIACVDPALEVLRRRNS